jgi:hypothetical protein
MAKPSLGKQVAAVDRHWPVASVLSAAAALMTRATKVNNDQLSAMVPRLLRRMLAVISMSPQLVTLLCDDAPPYNWVSCKPTEQSTKNQSLHTTSVCGHHNMLTPCLRSQHAGDHQQLIMISAW